MEKTRQTCGEKDKQATDSTISETYLDRRGGKGKKEGGGRKNTRKKEGGKKEKERKEEW